MAFGIPLLRRGGMVLSRHRQTYTVEGYYKGRFIRRVSSDKKRTLSFFNSFPSERFVK